MNTITAGDFTVEMDITHEMFQKFIELRNNDKTGKFEKKSIGHDFKKYIKDHIENELTKFMTPTEKDKTKKS